MSLFHQRSLRLGEAWSAGYGAWRVLFPLLASSLLLLLSCLLLLPVLLLTHFPAANKRKKKKKLPSVPLSFQQVQTDVLGDLSGYVELLCVLDTCTCTADMRIVAICFPMSIAVYTRT